MSVWCGNITTFRTLPSRCGHQFWASHRSRSFSATTVGPFWRADRRFVSPSCSSSSCSSWPWKFGGPAQHGPRPRWAYPRPANEWAASPPPLPPLAGWACPDCPGCNTCWTSNNSRCYVMNWWIFDRTRYKPTSGPGRRLSIRPGSGTGRRSAPVRANTIGQFFPFFSFISFFLWAIFSNFSCFKLAVLIFFVRIVAEKLLFEIVFVHCAGSQYISGRKSRTNRFLIRRLFPFLRNVFIYFLFRSQLIFQVITSQFLLYFAVVFVSSFSSSFLPFYSRCWCLEGKFWPSASPVNNSVCWLCWLFVYLFKFFVSRSSSFGQWSLLFVAQEE